MKVRVPVWELTDAELEDQAAKRDARDPLHAAELRRFAQERRLSVREWLRLHTDRLPPFPAELLDRPVGQVRPGPTSAVGRWLRGIMAERSE